MQRNNYINITQDCIGKSLEAPSPSKSIKQNGPPPIEGKENEQAVGLLVTTEGKQTSALSSSPILFRD